MIRAFARAFQAFMEAEEITGLKTTVDELVTPSETPESGGSDDIGDISWTVPTVTLRYPSNIEGRQGHHWSSAIAMATPVAHKGAVAGAKVVAATLLDPVAGSRPRRISLDVFPRGADGRRSLRTVHCRG